MPRCPSWGLSLLGHLSTSLITPDRGAMRVAARYEDSVLMYLVDVNRRQGTRRARALIPDCLGFGFSVDGLRLGR